MKYALVLTALIASTSVAAAQHLPAYGLPVADQIKQGLRPAPPAQDRSVDEVLASIRRRIEQDKPSR
jgi:hypothetical protein